MLQRVKELCRYLPGLEGDTRSRCCSQIVICAALVLFRSAFLYVSAVQPALFHGELLLLLFLMSLLVLYTICFSEWCVLRFRWCVLYLAGVSALNSGPWILVEDLSSVYNDVEVERGGVKHAHKKRKLTDGREKTMVPFFFKFLLQYYVSYL